MWLVVVYQPTALFSLRPASATSSGGKTLLVPTPFALKMALLDACIRTRGLVEGKERFPTIRDLHIAIQLPERLVVNNTFIKILRPVEIKEKKTAEQKIARQRADKQWPYQNTIAFREYVHFAGEMSIAFHSPEDALPVEVLSDLTLQISYIGKRGGFLQLVKPPILLEECPADFTLLTEGISHTFPIGGMLQVVDDCGSSLTFEKANIYNSRTRIMLEQDRVLRHVVLPYRLARSSRSFSYYERL